jgi:hypothetical protein
MATLAAPRAEAVVERLAVSAYGKAVRAGVAGAALAAAGALAWQVNEP